MTLSSQLRLRAMRRATWGLLLLGALEAAGCRHSGELSSAMPRDGNVILITLDTTRADRLGCYAGLKKSVGRKARSAKTPHLDALAARGVLFSHATVQVPLTLPSHASIMTGKYPPVHGLRDMEGFVLDPSNTTLATAASAGGAATAAFVGSRVLARDFGLAAGFASYDDEMPRHPEENAHAGVFAERSAAVVTDRALAWIRSNRERRFLTWVHYFDPHAPYDPPEPHKSVYAQDPYSGEVAYTDEQVGRLLDGVRQMGLESRTLVAVLADHGESLGEHGEMTHGVFLYDSTLHVPFLLAGPGITPGKVIHEQVRSIDLLPTVLAFLKLPPIGGVQGVSLWPLIQQGVHGDSDHSYSETLYPRTYMGWSELSAMRTDQWKLVAAPRPELYDLKNDPEESQNVISKHPEEAERLRNRIAGLEKNRSKNLSPSPMDPATRRQFESLGYLSGGASRQITLGTPAPDPKDRLETLTILSQAEDLLAKKQYPSAAKLMEKGLRLDPGNPRCHLALGMAYEQMGQYRRAVEVFRHALEAKIQTDRIYSRLGIDYLHLGQTERAIEALEQAAVINPKDLDNLLNLGMAYLQLGQGAKGEQTFRTITSRDDRHAAAHNGLGLIAAQRGDKDTAQREFERAVELDPHEAKFVLDLGILHQQAGNTDRALQYLEMFLVKAPPGRFDGQIAAVRDAVRELKATRQRTVRR